MKKTLTAAMLIAIASTAGAQTLAKVPVAPESRLWIDGTSNLHGWSCKATAMDATIEVESSATQAVAAAPSTLKQVEVKVPVKSLKCGHDAMDNNLYKALKADEDPSIAYIMATFEATPDAREGFTLHTTGTLKIAGAEKPLSMDVVAARSADGSLRATGSVTVKMTDFGIQPPTAIFGRLKTGDDVKVNFDLSVGSKAIAAATASSSSSK